MEKESEESFIEESKKILNEEENFIKWFSELSMKDVSDVGGKGANLGEMYNKKFPVPPGFVLTSHAYDYFLKETGLKKQIYEELSKIDEEDTVSLENESKKIRERIEKASMPYLLEKEIIEAYEALNLDDNLLDLAKDKVLTLLQNAKEDVFVAVRSSATSEDSAEASFAGQQETFLNIKGKRELINAIKGCFASLFSPRSIYYRIKKNFKHEDVLIAVVIQKMINADKSGVIFSKDPVNNTENVIIESVFGLGEGIVSGRVKPDYCVVSKENKILENKVSEKKQAIVRDSSGENKIVKLTSNKGNSPVLSDSEIKKLARYALELEEHYNLPQDIEFAIDSNEIYIVQTRPITTLKTKTEKINIDSKDKKILLKGIPASPGIGVGKVKIIHDLKDLNKISKGDILVTKMTNPDMVVTMQKSSGVVTDEGGQTCHAAIISREMGIPAIVGTGDATSILKDNEIITVDAFNGVVYEDKVEEERKTEILPIIKTNTKIKVNVDLPSSAERAKLTQCDEVGLIRLEGIISESGKHPFFFLNNNIKEYEDIIYKGLNEISKYFNKLWIRTSDLRSDEYRNLKGSPQEKEQNPMLGLHGIRTGLKYKEILKSELIAISRIGKEKKVGILLPQVISIEEVEEVKKIMNENNIQNIDLGVMIETPSSVQIIKSLCEAGIKFISFGTNDLTQYTLAIDRNNEKVQYLYNETHPAVLRQLRNVIKICKKHNIETSICGQAANNKKMVKFLIENEIDGISVNADKAKEISEFVYSLENNGQMPSESDEKVKEIENKEQENVVNSEENSKKSEEFPDLDINVDVFSQNLNNKEDSKSQKDLDIF
jgi:pyruvate, water dikinase